MHEVLRQVKTQNPFSILALHAAFTSVALGATPGLLILLVRKLYVCCRCCGDAPKPSRLGIRILISSGKRAPCLEKNVHLTS